MCFTVCMRPVRAYCVCVCVCVCMCIPPHCWTLKFKIISACSCKDASSRFPFGLQAHNRINTVCSQFIEHNADCVVVSDCGSEGCVLVENRPQHVVCVMSSESVSLWCGSKIISSKEISQEKRGKKSRQPKGQMKIRGKQYTRAHRLAPGTAQRPHCHGSPRHCTHTPACLGRRDTCWWLWSTAGRVTGHLHRAANMGTSFGVSTVNEVIQWHTNVRMILDTVPFKYSHRFLSQLVLLLCSFSLSVLLHES